MTAKRLPGKSRIYRFFSVWLLLFSCLAGFHVCADDLARAAELEASGDRDTARDLYIRWLTDDENRADPGYGRTLLHLLRSGGTPETLFGLLERFLPYVENPQDKLEAVRFGAYLADLTGRFDLSQRYFYQLMIADPRTDWIREYFSLLEKGSPEPSDPLNFTSDLVDEEHAKNRMILYLISLYVNKASEETVIHWIERAETAFPFLRNYPDWYYAVWLICRNSALMDIQNRYKGDLIRNFPDSPEAGILEREVEILLPPVFLVQRDPRLMQENADTVEKYEYIQMGSFGSLEHAEKFCEEIKRDTGLSPEVFQIEGLYKVILATSTPGKDQDALKKSGYDSFTVALPPGHSR